MEFTYGFRNISIIFFHFFFSAAYCSSEFSSFLPRRELAPFRRRNENIPLLGRAAHGDFTLPILSRVLRRAPLTFFMSSGRDTASAIREASFCAMERILLGSSSIIVGETGVPNEVFIF